ncbi:MAG TPA: ATPase domain-containing protein, partial [Candidatus Bathyarchaeia archaeon]|nr:ATPase domain-containing protein [Candidatus Bathyarchaeia archaeon]
SNLDFTVTINIASKTPQTLSLYYDVPAYKSQAALTFQSRLGTLSSLTLDSTGTPNQFFSRNSTLTNRQVTIRALAFDAIGLYDVGLVNASITSPGGSSYLSNTPLVMISGSPSGYAGTWSLNFTYAVGDASGNYIINLELADNTGTAVSLQLSFELYATWKMSLQTFSSDSVAVPVSGALVTVYSSGTPVFSGVSDSSGSVVPASVLLRDNVSYYVTTIWRGVLVNQTITFGLSAPTNLVLRLSIYTVNFASAFRSGSGKLLSSEPSSFMLTSHVNGSTTSPSPSGNYLLPAGTYTISSVIWNGVDVTPSGGVSFNPRSGTPAIDLAVYNLTVLAVDQNGQAIPNAQVTVTRNDQVIAQGTTGNDGSLVLGNLPVGQYVVQVKSQSQSVSSTISLTQDTSQRVQVVPPSSSAWLVQSWGWFVLVGAAIGSILGYRQISRSRLTSREESFDYLTSITGGFRDGDTILIVGDEATGKTTLCEEIAYRALTSASPVAFLTYEGAEKVRESMKTHRWDPSPWEPGMFQLIPCETIRGSDLSYGMVENFYGITALNISMNDALGEAKPGKPVMIVDPLTSLAETASVSGLMSMLLEMSDKIRKLQGRLFLSIDQSIPKHALSRIEDAADGVLSLNHVIENGKRAVDLRVKKMR